MKKINSITFLSVLLIIISLALYALELVIFRKPGNTLFYFLQDMAFLPLQAVIVIIVLGKIISGREKRLMLKKINMAISAFFSEAGTEIMSSLLEFCRMPGDISANLDVSGKWIGGDYKKAIKFIKENDFVFDCKIENLQALKALMLQKRNFLLIMLENPNLLEHDTFSDLLWAVFHLTDELLARESLTDLPAADIKHLALDIKRAFNTLIVQWLSHMEHLKTDYPYLFSLEVRKNPFSENNSVIIKE